MVTSLFTAYDGLVSTDERIQGDTFRLANSAIDYSHRQRRQTTSTMEMHSPTSWRTTISTPMD